MKGKSQFSLEEVEQIRYLLRLPNRTKSTRDALRRIPFYISDFPIGGNERFLAEDFDRLVANGTIVITY